MVEGYGFSIQILPIELAYLGLCLTTFVASSVNSSSTPCPVTADVRWNPTSAPATRPSSRHFSRKLATAGSEGEQSALFPATAIACLIPGVANERRALCQADDAAVRW